MLKYRVWMQVPGADRPQQAICATEKMARDFLQLLLDAGQPTGTKWAIYRTTEVVVMEDTV